MAIVRYQTALNAFNQLRINLNPHLTYVNHKPPDFTADLTGSKTNKIGEQCLTASLVLLGLLLHHIRKDYINALTILCWNFLYFLALQIKFSYGNKRQLITTSDKF